MMLHVALSPGELLDRLTILEIKQERISDRGNLACVHADLAEVRRAWAEAPAHPELDRLAEKLRGVNLALWDIEDGVRQCLAAGDEGPRFVELAKAVPRHNDRRAALKRRVNELLGSALTEVKEHPAYA
jgi:hypothetical protein